jgi:hypothetical protein
MMICQDSRFRSGTPQRVENVSTLHHLSEGLWYRNNVFHIWFHDIYREEVYRLLFSRMVSDGCQIIPFCRAEQDLQDHTLLAPATPVPRKTYLASSHPLPSLFSSKNALRRLKFRFAGTGNGNQKLNLSSFRQPLTARPRKSSKSTFVRGTNFLYQTDPSLVHFLYR